MCERERETGRRGLSGSSSDGKGEREEEVDRHVDGLYSSDSVTNSFSTTSDRE